MRVPGLAKGLFEPVRACIRGLPARQAERGELPERAANTLLPILRPRERGGVRGAAQEQR